MQVIVNGKPMDTEKGQKLDGLLRTLGLDEPVPLVLCHYAGEERTAGRGEVPGYRVRDDPIEVDKSE